MHWRDEHGLTWIENAPLIQLLPDLTARDPYPLYWEEQGRLFQALPDHLTPMRLFKVDTGCREQEVCGLRWDWEAEVPELQELIDAAEKLLPRLRHRRCRKEKRSPRKTATA